MTDFLISTANQWYFWWVLVLYIVLGIQTSTKQIRKSYAKGELNTLPGWLADGVVIMLTLIAVFWVVVPISVALLKIVTEP